MASTTELSMKSSTLTKFLRQLKRDAATSDFYRWRPSCSCETLKIYK